ncbi:AraC family transcriptional regulator [Chelativorans sp.]|uniref:AraC family transcriptional regulator n=1 Tax=Chelativorans sp. TaxID=2203393 RepID=UPI0028126855|nr:AraC family transcriptional regulator [Chelativorans sp.]
MNLKRVRADGILAEYGRVLPGEGFSHTPGSAIGVAFTPQRRAYWSIGAQQLGGVIQPASVMITPAEGIEWQAWDLISDSIEIWLDSESLSRWSQEHGGPNRIEFDLHDRIHDPIIIDLAARVRRLLCADHPSGDALAALGRELGEHFLRVYAGLRIPFEERPLDQRRLKRVLDHIEAHLERPLDLEQLADVAAMSTFHFARCFKAATGSSPHVFVVARRMDRAAALLRASRLPVARVAEAVGFTSLPHFRRHFRAHWGAGPGEFAGGEAGTP